MSSSSFFQFLPKGGAAKAKPKPAPKAKSGIAFIKAPAPVVRKKTAATAAAQKSAVEAETDTIDVSVCDILYIDSQIKKKFASRRETGILADLQKDLTNLSWIVSNSPDEADQIQAKKDMTTLRSRIRDVEASFDLACYIWQTGDLIEKYRGLAVTTTSSSFVRIQNDTTSSLSFEKNALVLEYLRIAKTYVNLENMSKFSPASVCVQCRSSRLETNDDDILVCLECGTENENLDESPTFKDSERVNMASRYTYTCRGHFIEAMNRFEGKQNIVIDPEIIKLLKAELKLHGLTYTPGPKMAAKDHVYMFLVEKKLCDIYADINLIYFLITGVNPPDITQYRDEILEMLEYIEEAYLYVKDKGRNNSLNVNWKLYKLLQLVDYRCTKSDFYCLKTPNKQDEHDETWTQMIDYLIAKYPNAKTSKGKKRWRHIRSL